MALSESQVVAKFVGSHRAERYGAGDKGFDTVESGGGETGLPTCPGSASKTLARDLWRAEREQGTIRNILGGTDGGVD